MKKDKSTIIKRAVKNLFATFQRVDFSNQLTHSIIRKHDADRHHSVRHSFCNHNLMFSSNTKFFLATKIWQKLKTDLEKLKITLQRHL